MKNNIIVKSISSISDFKELFNDIYSFCKHAVNETKILQKRKNIDLSQTIKNMDWENWTTTSDCLLHRIFIQKGFSDGKGMCTFLYKDNKIIASGGVELWNRYVSNISKRTYVLQKYRKQNLSSTYLSPAGIEWIEKYKPEVKIHMTTFNTYLKDALFKTMLKFKNREIDGDWNIWPEWDVYPGTLFIYGCEQFVMYKIIDKTIENTPEKIKEIIMNKEIF